MKDDKEKKEKEERNQKPSAANTASQLEPAPDKTIDIEKEKEVPDHSEFSEWDNLLGENTDLNQEKSL